MSDPPAPSGTEPSDEPSTPSPRADTLVVIALLMAFFGALGGMLIELLWS